jgi:hypothetical protein
LKDYDVEVYGLSPSKVMKVLQAFGPVSHVGTHFGVFKVGGISPPVDVSLPRRDTKIGPGHQGFSAEIIPSLSFKEAAGRRDLRINSMGYNPQTQELLDPFGGQEDLKLKRLRATNPLQFGEDPLRGLRVAQFAARFSMEPDEELTSLCAQLDLTQLSGERLWGEWEKLLSLSTDPSHGLRFLFDTGQMKFFPGLTHLGGGHEEEAVPDSPFWELREKVLGQIQKLGELYPPPRPLSSQALLLFLLLKDAWEEERSDFFIRVKGPKVLRALGEEMGHMWEKIERLSQVPLSRPQYYCWAERLAPFGITLQDVCHVAQVLAEEEPQGALLAGERDKFYEWGILDTPPPAPVVKGKDMGAWGILPGPEMGQILNQCRIYQYASGEREAEKILEAVLGRKKPK